MLFRSISTREMLGYMEHVAHATAGLRPGERRLGHRRSQRKVERRLRRFWERDLVKELRGAGELDKAKVKS